MYIGSNYKKIDPYQFGVHARLYLNSGLGGLWQRWHGLVLSDFEVFNCGVEINWFEVNCSVMEVGSHIVLSNVVLVGLEFVILGCKTHLHIPKPLKDSLDGKTWECKFIRYVKNGSGSFYDFIIVRCILVYLITLMKGCFVS